MTVLPLGLSAFCRRREPAFVPSPLTIILQYERKLMVLRHTIKAYFVDCGRFEETTMLNESPMTISVPEAGKRYFGLSRDGSYRAAERGDIPTIRVGRLLRVPVRVMERILDTQGRPGGRQE